MRAARLLVDARMAEGLLLARASRGPAKPAQIVLGIRLVRESRLSRLSERKPQTGAHIRPRKLTAKRGSRRSARLQCSELGSAFTVSGFQRSASIWIKSARSKDAIYKD
jgi:hypothetical protein